MNRRPLNPITEADIEAYERDGAVCLRGMFDRDWTDRMREASVKAVADFKGLPEQTSQRPNGAPRVRGKDHTSSGAPFRFVTLLFLWRSYPDFRDFALESPAAEIGGRMMRSKESRFFYDQLFTKDASVADRTVWHQDLPFWPVTGNHIASIWLALTPVRRDTSGVEYVAGSHLWGKHYNPLLTATSKTLHHDELEPCPDFSLHRDDPKYRFLSWDMEPGDVLVHHPLAVHGSGPNQSATQRRIGFSTRWLGDDARWVNKDKTMYVEGDPKLKDGDKPVGEPFPLCWEAQRETVNA
jgi:ectoine hydroxylase-related dioxygenase (phytanoyl-CoA dioxygenase family)